MTQKETPRQVIIDSKRVQEIIESAIKHIESFKVTDAEFMYIIMEIGKNAQMIDEMTRAFKLQPLFLQKLGQKPNGNGIKKQENKGRSGYVG